MCACSMCTVCCKGQSENAKGLAGPCWAMLAVLLLALCLLGLHGRCLRTGLPSLLLLLLLKGLLMLRQVPSA